MRYKVEFQYRPKDNARPLDYVQEFDMSGDDHTFQPIPNISDQVHIEVFEADSSRDFLVVESRLFSYVGKPDDHELKSLGGSVWEQQRSNQNGIDR